MDSLLREEQLLGSSKVILGSPTEDLVLESLGRLYLKQGNAFQDITEMLMNTDTSSSSSITTSIVEDILKERASDYKDGVFVLDKVSGNLYITYNKEFHPIASISQGNTNYYVRKTGDTMTGQLKVQTIEAPFKVTSSQIVKNLNSNYLDGKSSQEYAIKALDETIQGNWTHTGDTTLNTTTINGTTTFNNEVTVNGVSDFNDTINAHQVVIFDDNITSPEFQEGYDGYGWRLDISSNTLTIDNLVVRKTMQVYELIVNKILATNGSLWITNAFKVDKVHTINYINSSGLSLNDFIALLEDDSFYIVYNTNSNYHEVNLPAGALSNSLTKSVAGTRIYYDYCIYVESISAILELISTNTIETITGLLEILTHIYLYNSEVSNTTPVTYTLDTTFTNLNTTPKYTIIPKSELGVNRTYTLSTDILLYYKYFGSCNYYIISAKEGEYPVFRPGDLIRCQKFDNKSIKYYDALVIGYYDAYSFIIQLANLNYNKVLTLEEIEKVNPTIEDSAIFNTSLPYQGGWDEGLTTPAIEDQLVQIGSISNIDRQGSIYLTSYDTGAPFIDVVDGINRPDYTVIYYTPKYATFRNGRYIYYIQKDDTGYITNDINWTISADSEYGCRYLTGNEIIESPEPNKYTAELVNHTKTRLGKLDGVSNDIFGDKLPQGFGLYGENVYLTGDFYLNNGKSVVEASRDGIFLRYADAGISIAEDNGSEVIELQADKIKIKNGDQTAALFTNGKISGQYITVDNLFANNVVATLTGNYDNTVTPPAVIDLGKPYVTIDGNTGILKATNAVIKGTLLPTALKHTDGMPVIVTDYATNLPMQILGYNPDPDEKMIYITDEFWTEKWSAIVNNYIPTGATLEETDKYKIAVWVTELLWQNSDYWKEELTRSLKNVFNTFTGASLTEIRQAMDGDTSGDVLATGLFEYVLSDLTTTYIPFDLCLLYGYFVLGTMTVYSLLGTEFLCSTTDRGAYIEKSLVNNVGLEFTIYNTSSDSSLSVLSGIQKDSGHWVSSLLALNYLLFLFSFYSNRMTVTGSSLNGYSILTEITSGYEAHAKNVIIPAKGSVTLLARSGYWEIIKITGAPLTIEDENGYTHKLYADFKYD